MQIHIKTVHLELTGSVDTYVHDKVSRLSKFLTPHQDEAAILEVHLRYKPSDIKDTKDQCTLTITGLGKGRAMHVEAEEPDMHVAIDRAAQRMEEQLRREKEKRRDHIHKQSKDGKYIPPEDLMDV